MAAFPNIFLVLFLADGVLSLLVGMGRGFRFLGGFAGTVTLVTWLMAGLIALMLAVTPRLPKRVLVPPLLFLLFGLFYGMPLPLHVGLGRACLLLSGLQVLVGCLALALIRWTTVSRRWFLTESDLPARRFSLRHTLLFLGACGFVVLPAWFFYAGVCLSSAVSHYTGGFVHVGWRQVRMEERGYVRGDKQVRLVAMAHIGDPKFYRDLNQSFRGERSLVLEEGVTDTNRVLRSFRRDSYKKVAGALGLQAQDHKLMNKANVRWADVDVSEFSPKTREVLNAIGLVFQGGKPHEVVTAYLRYSQLFAGQHGEAADRDRLEGLWNDLLKLRNRRCLDRLQTALADHDRVVIPWGAYHMPGLERGILEQGFTVSNTCMRTIMQW